MESPKCPTTLGGEMVGLVSSFSSFWRRGGAEVSLLNVFILLGSSRMVSIVLEASTRLSTSSESLATCLEKVSISKMPGKNSMEGERNSISTPVVSLEEGLAFQPGGQFASFLQPSFSKWLTIILIKASS